MKLIRSLAISGVLTAAMLTVAGCGGDDRLSDEEYFQRLTDLDNETDQRFESFDEDTTAGEVKQTFSDVIDDYVQELDDIEPPEDAEDAHNEIISALEEFSDKLEGIDVDDDAPGDEVFASEEFDTERVDAAFCELQTLADDKGIEADVGCEEEEGAVDPSTLPAEETTEVTIQDFAFNPPHIQVSVGDTVTWTHADPEPHTVTADDDSFDSGILGDGDTFEFTFEEAGEFFYHCEPHPDMLGLVTVTE